MLKKVYQDKNLKKNKNIIPSREFILSFLEKQKKPLNCYELAQKINLHIKHITALHRRLNSMKNDGQLMYIDHKYYILPKNLDILSGYVIGHRDGYGFLRVEGMENDLYLSSRQMKFCMHGDIILVHYLKQINCKRRFACYILRVEKPRNNQIVGRYIINLNIGCVIPNDNRLNFNIIVPKKLNMNASIGSIVIVKITKRYTDNNKIIGKIIKILGNYIDSKLAINIALYTHDIPHVWPKSITKQTNNNIKISKKEKEERIDMRQLPFITIDDENAYDLDDAVYCEAKKDGGWCLWVAIADVSYYVRPGTLLDKEAYERGTSIYFPLQVVISMLPKYLSQGLCSLKPKVDRLSIICEMNISSKGDLISFKHYEAIIRSCARLSYTNAWKILQKNTKLCQQYSLQVKLLKELYNMYKVLEIARKTRGGISFQTKEPKFIFNDENNIEHIEYISHNDAHKLIEECMILANIASASFVENNKLPMLFRNHDKPSDSSIKIVCTVLHDLGLYQYGVDKVKSLDYKKLLKQISNRSDVEMLQTMLLRAMKPAIYHPDNRGHFGLSLTSYAHFTSPIRRYPDLLLHRSIKYLLAKKKYEETKKTIIKTGGYYYNKINMLQFGQHCSFTERRADIANRDVIDWLKCDFMKNKIGNIFSGLIYNITNFGFFVRINDLFIDGLVHISMLNDDYYRLDSIKQYLIGISSGKIYKLGDLVKVCIKEVHIDERRIDFSLVS